MSRLEWPTPWTPTALAAGARRLGELGCWRGRPTWVEGRPDEGGRGALVTITDSGALTEIGPDDLSVRSLVHEYGGGSWADAGDTVLASRASDQALVRLDGSHLELVVAGPEPRSHRYADLSVCGPVAVGVRERHEVDEPINELVRIELDTGRVEVLDAGHDFVSAPRLSPDGRQLAWLSWDHPNMPWDEVTLWVAALSSHGELGERRRLGGGGTAPQQPRWSSDGRLLVITDPEGWWNLHEVTEAGLVPLHRDQVEAGAPPWSLGLSTYDLLADGTPVLAWFDGGRGHLGRLIEGELVPCNTDLEVASLVALPSGRIAAVAGSPTLGSSVVEIDPVSGDYELLRTSIDELPDPAWISVPESVTFSSPSAPPSATDDVQARRTVQAFWYPPANPDVELPPGPAPAMVISHGGPTGATYAVLRPLVQAFTSRGIGVIDVNYGGSTGFGRAYRELLHQGWGVVDVEDCVAAVDALVERGTVDPDRVFIRGSSAGGLTTLNALIGHGDRFRGGVSIYGVADLTRLATDTHKFEARYLDTLVGPWPEAEAVYRDRSPLTHADRLRTPMLILQGADDPIVPPSQSEAVVDALEANQVPHTYVCFPGESHGFRGADAVVRALAVELEFLDDLLVDREEQA